MNIVFVSDAIFPYNKGGKEKRLYELSTRLAKLGHDVHIYTMHWWQTPEKIRTENGVHLHALCKKYDMYHGDRRGAKEGVLFAAACLKLLFVSFDVLDADHIPFFPIFSTWLVCTLRRKKLYGTWHEAWTLREWTGYMGKMGYVAAAFEKLSIVFPYRITAASEHTRRLLAVNHRRTKRVEVVASGVDLAAIRRAPVSKSTCDVLYVGRLVKDKNVDMIIKAVGQIAQRNPDVRCVIVGHGIERDNLRRLVARLRLEKNITMLDPLPSDAAVYSLMKAAKVFALPSVREGFGIVALEAIACGTPVVTVDVPGNAAKELVTDGETGSVVGFSESQLAEAIAFWVVAGKKQSAGKQLINSDWDTLAEKQAQVYSL